MSFEFNPLEDDPHGECRHEIDRLQAENAELRAENRILRSERDEALAIIHNAIMKPEGR